MQKTLFKASRALILSIGVIAIGCGFGNSPSKVARRFLDVVEKGDYKAFYTVMTPETATAALRGGEMAKTAITVKGGVVSTREENGTKTDGFGYPIADEENMIVHVTFKDGSEGKLSLRKIDGKWKVHEPYY
ncbi:MAG: DUF4878 domain-containing protein [Holophagales bacterium]|jgi:hypothetical protein|nr:DUF4878 domain-containing protein [Holophagales bacterium]